MTPVEILIIGLGLLNAFLWAFLNMRQTTTAPEPKNGSSEPTDPLPEPSHVNSKIKVDAARLDDRWTQWRLKLKRLRTKYAIEPRR